MYLLVFCTIHVFYTIRVWYIPYAYTCVVCTILVRVYGTYHMRICVWLVQNIGIIKSNEIIYSVCIIMIKLMKFLGSYILFIHTYVSTGSCAGNWIYSGMLVRLFKYTQSCGTECKSQ